jgi:hypothetical protein
MLDEKQRSTNLAARHEAYRPGYPLALRELLVRECGLGPGLVVADVGSGTGKLSRRLLDSGARMTAVEPGPGGAEEWTV